MNLIDLVLRWGRDSPQAPAIIESGRTLTCAELSDASARAAAMLRQAGIGKGAPVLVLVPMNAELYVLLAALWRVGAVAVVVDPSAGAGHLERSLERMPPLGFVGTGMAQLLRLRWACVRRIPHVWSTGFPLACRRWHGWRRMDADLRIEEVGDDHPALVTFTSGSTGVPKGAVRSHGFLRAQHAAVARSLDHRIGAVDLSTLPIFALANLASGQSVLIPDADVRRPGSIDPAPVLAQLAQARPRSAVASPAFFARLADAADCLEPLEAIYTGGAPVFPALLERLQKLAPAARVVAVYGSTEAEPIAEIAFGDMSSADLAAQRGGKGLLAGPVVQGIDLMILPDRWGAPIAALTDAEAMALQLGPDAPGEITVAGEHVLTGYLGGIGDAETKFTVGARIWHRTGDAGFRDTRGRLWLLGRCSATVSDADGTLYPFAVEAAAQSISGVRRAALVVRDGRRVLAVEAESGATPTPRLEQELAWARLERIIPCRIPLDRRHNAKVDYVALARLLNYLPRNATHGQ